MRSLLIIIILTITRQVFGQTDTLKTDEIQFYIIGGRNGYIENYKNEKVLISISFKGEKKQFYNFTFIHLRNELQKQKVNFNLSKIKSSLDTLSVLLSEVLPGDKFVLYYAEKKIEYIIQSTYYSNNKPYFMDFKFTFNGDTITAKKYKLVDLKSVKISNKIYRVEGLLNHRRIKVKYKNQIIEVDLLREKVIEPVFHGMIVLEYVDNLDKIKNREQYRDWIDFARKNNCNTISMFSKFDYDTKMNPDKGVLCIE